MKPHAAFLLAAATLFVWALPAQAQFDQDDDERDESLVCDDDVFEPILPVRPMIAPVLGDPFSAVDSEVLCTSPRRRSDRAAEVLADDCGLDPDVARAALKADIVDDDGDCPKFLGRLSANPYAADSTANPYSNVGSPYSAKSVNNPYGSYGSEYSAKSARNPYATDAPKIVAQDGTYLGELSDNPYDPDSVANPYGRYGNPYSPTSIKNPYSKYGSPYSSQSPNNPYATQAPLLFGD